MLFLSWRWVVCVVMIIIIPMILIYIYITIYQGLIILFGWMFLILHLTYVLVFPLPLFVGVFFLSPLCPVDVLARVLSILLPMICDTQEGAGIMAEGDSTLAVTSSLAFFLSSLFLSIPVGSLIIFVPSPRLRHVFSLIAGVLLFRLAYGQEGELSLFQPVLLMQ